VSLWDIAEQKESKALLTSLLCQCLPAKEIKNKKAELHQKHKSTRACPKVE
jgi:hypothetical protein